MHKRMMVVSALFLATVPVTGAYAQSMPVSVFLAKAEALQKKGMMAMFSSDFSLLKSEWKSAAKALDAQQAAERRAGRKPTLCMPEKAAMSVDEVMSYLRSIPPAQRGMSFQAALAGLVRKKYPC